MSQATNSRARGFSARFSFFIIWAFVFSLMPSAPAAIGPTSTLYITSYAEFSAGTETGLDLVQGNTVNSFPTGYPVGICIGVGADVRTFGYGNGDKGGRFSLAGAPLSGGPYTNGVTNSQFHDGTSDGLYNYTIDYTNSQVLRYDLNWANPSLLFTASAAMGWITYNPADNTFWLSQWGGPDLVEHRSFTGTLLGSFNSGVSTSQGLAFDPADGTLWMGDFGYNLYQFNQSGTLLQSPNYVLSTGQWYGMEFALPEPGSIMLLSVGVTLLISRRRR